jgi:3-hydroxyacyl-[acyl-carrier-protein] dehydratase
MKLKNSFFTIEESSSATQIVVRLNSEHPIYQAHFPGEPITPGVCIIQIAKELLEEALQRGNYCENDKNWQGQYHLVAVKNVKFLAPISPLETPLVTYTLQKVTLSDDGTIVKAQITVESTDKLMAKLSLTLRAGKSER